MPYAIMKARARALPESLPVAIARAVDGVTARVLGKRDVTGAALSDALAVLSEVYTGATRGGRAPVDVSRTNHEAALAARARFFFLRDLPKIALPLAELRARDALPKRETLRVLDVGAGLGAMTFGVAHFARLHRLCTSLDVVAIDHDARSMAWLTAFAREIDASAELASLVVPTRVTTRSVNLVSDTLDSLGEFDLIVCGFVLNELFEKETEERALQARASLLEKLGQRLSEHGSLIVLEPALKQTSRNLSRARDLLTVSSQLNVFAPCVRTGPCPMLLSERDWCHESTPYALPEAAAELARGAGLRFEGLSFSYLTLRRDGRRLSDTLSGRGGPFRVVSDPLPSKGKHELYGCGEDGRVRLTLLLRDESEPNRVLLELGRGDVFSTAAGSLTDAEDTEIKRKITATVAVTRLENAQDPLQRADDL